MIRVTRINQDGVRSLLGIAAHNIVECTPKDEGESWIKYWDGERIRAAVIEEAVDDVVYLVQKAKHGKKV